MKYWKIQITNIVLIEDYTTPSPHYRAVTPVTKHVLAPVDRPAPPPTTGGLPTGQNICAECERLIV